MVSIIVRENQLSFFAAVVIHVLADPFGMFLASTVINDKFSTIIDENTVAIILCGVRISL